MGWTDKSCIKTIKQLKNDFGIGYVVETGTFRGQGARVFSTIFDRVITCDTNREYFGNFMGSYANSYQNVAMFNIDSAIYLKTFMEFYRRTGRNDIVLFYLDAHFYDPNLPVEDRFVIIRELQSLKDFKNCIIIIHDFDNKELGHLTYDGIPLDTNLIGKYLQEVNPDFKYYTNTKEFCDILTVKDLEDGNMPPLTDSEENKETLSYVWSSDEKTYRGILYCIPSQIDLSKYALREFIWN